MTTLEPNTASAADLMELATDGDGALLPGQRETQGVFTSDGQAMTDPSAGRAPEYLEPGGALDLLPAHSNGHAQPTAAGPIPVPIPIPVSLPRPVSFPLRVRAASGLYRSPALGFQLELRVDVDGARPLRKLSGDYFSISGATASYFGSWTVDAVTVTTSSSEIVIVGTARTTWATTFTVARVSIPRTTLFQPAAPATITWFTPSGARGATYTCAWAASAFRTVELEQDCEAGVTPFASYNTGLLPSGGPTRTLSTAGGYAEAGIRMLDTGAGNVITTPAGFIWNNASLHNAMLTHFSRAAERPQFKVWLLHAMRHELGTGLLGIMFDQTGLQRQGCASFYQRISSGSPADVRTQLYVNVHELGHCFNLFHSFHKSFMTPPLPNRPGSLSWMNYPAKYNPGGGAPSGEAAFWAGFNFQFDDLELAHVRHGFRDAVIMGGNPFGGGAALEAGADYVPGMAPVGLELEISTTPQRPTLGTPIVLAINLRASRGRTVHDREQLHPKFGFVEVALERPNGEVVIHRPPVQHCAVPEVHIAEAEENLPVSAYIGYDAVKGQLFEDVGTYKIRATYTAPDGMPVASNIIKLRVAGPHDRTDERMADLLLGDQAGMVLTLLGTDSAYLAAGTEAMETIVAEHGEHPNAVYARLALGVNAARPFLQLATNGTTTERPADVAAATALLAPAIEASRGTGGLDDLTTYQMLDALARSHESAGDTKSARATRKDAVALARSKEEPASVIRSLER